MHNKIADEFDRWAEAGRADSMAKGHQSVVFQMLERLQLKPEMRVLDVGCGNGWAIEEMLQRGAGQGVGVDISPQMIALAHQKASVNAQYFVSKGAQLPVESESIDFLLCVESLYYHPSPLDSVREWYRVVASKGRIGLMVDLYQESPATHTWIDALSIPVHLLSMSEYVQLFVDAGFTQVVAEQIQSTDPYKERSGFVPSPYWPSYEMYTSYRETGSLVLWAQRP